MVGEREMRSPRSFLAVSGAISPMGRFSASSPMAARNSISPFSQRRAPTVAARGSPSAVRAA